MLARSAFRSRHRNAGRPASARAPRFLQWLRGRPCLLEKAGGCEGRIEAAHVDYAGMKGVGRKVDDRFAVPMCSGHHREQTDTSWPRFERKYDIDALSASKAFWWAWPGRISWERNNG